jgi:hypothetical protein
MTVLSFLQGRLFGPATSADSKSAGDAQPDPVADAAQGDLVDEALPPFAGYDGLEQREVRDRLSDHSQVELEALESYERGHKDRAPVLDRLRYMRGREPFPGYDALSAEEIVAALTEADQPTIKQVRAYERKFARRPEVLEEVARVHQRGRGTAGQPASAAPSYQPLGGAPASSAPVDRPERSARP